MWESLVYAWVLSASVRDRLIKVVAGMLWVLWGQRFGLVEERWVLSWLCVHKHSDHERINE